MNLVSCFAWCSWIHARCLLGKAKQGIHSPEIDTYMYGLKSNHMYETSPAHVIHVIVEYVRLLHLFAYVPFGTAKCNLEQQDIITAL